MSSQSPHTETPHAGAAANDRQRSAANPSQGLQVVTTVGSEADAARIAESLVQQRLAACVQIDPSIRSYYRWEGRVAIDDEWRLVIKTTLGRWDALQQAIAQLHPYALPELVATPIVLGSEGYLRWLVEQVQPADRTEEHA